MSKKSAALLMLPLIALSVFSVASVGAQRGGNSGGKKISCPNTYDQSSLFQDPTTGEWYKYFVAYCNGTPMAGVPVTWMAIYNNGQNACFIAVTGSSCIGSVTRVDLATSSAGSAYIYVYPSLPTGSWNIVATTP